MCAERNLKKLLGSMQAELRDGIFVFATFPLGDLPAGITPLMTFEEAEGTTLILLRSKAEAHDIPYESPAA